VKATEFLLRYLLQILPCGLMKIRYFSILVLAIKNMIIPLLQQLISLEPAIVDKSQKP
jgi:hypothetical protein